jgi:hypothetical protein
VVSNAERLGRVFPCAHLSARCRAEALSLCGVIRQRVPLFRAALDERGFYFDLTPTWLR